MIRLLLLFLLPSLAVAAPREGVFARIDPALLAPDGPSAAPGFELVLQPAPGVYRVVAEVEPDADLDGFDVELQVGDWAQVVVDRQRVIELAERPGVVRVRRPRTPTEHVTSEGVSAIGADVLHASGYDGTGAKVGILDSSFTGYDQLVDVPAADAAHVSWAPSLAGPGPGVHGTGCLEIVHDVAPGAEFFLANFATEVEYVAQLSWLVQQGVQVVSASIGFDNTQPMDGTGPLAQAVDAVRAAGVLYVGAAGNEGTKYWNGTWADTDGDLVLDFDTTVLPNLLPLVLNDTDQPLGPVPIVVRLRWLEPWGGAGVDLDLAVFEGTIADPLGTMQVLGQGADAQDGDDLPIEAIELNAVPVPAGSGIFAAVGHAGGGSPAGLDVRVWHYGELYSEYRSLTQTLTSPADAAGALSVGAVRWSDGGVPDYSSEGPTDDGRQKPEIYGPSHVSTEAYGPYGSEQPGQEGFSGTSAATPHVAGAAALLFGSGEYPTADDVEQALINASDPNISGGNGAGVLQLAGGSGCTGCGGPGGGPLLLLLLPWWGWLRRE